MLTKRQLASKRIFDVIMALLFLPFLLFPILLLVLLATLSTGAFGLFVQNRIGQQGRLFALYKIRSLKGTGHENVKEMKAKETSFGSWLRRSKLDELPQLFNVLFGSMSMVGPRPDIPGYADQLKGEDRIILQVKPGITGPATLKYRNEDALLMAQTNPNKYNDEVIWPDKVEINKAYIKNWSLASDIGYLWASVVRN